MPRCRFDSALLLTLLLMGMCAGADPRGAADSSRRLHQITHGQCTYTFILPEAGGAAGGSCRDASPARDANSVQRDAPPPDAHLPSQKIQQLESIMENYTQWLHKVRGERRRPPGASHNSIKSINVTLKPVEKNLIFKTFF